MRYRTFLLISIIAFSMLGIARPGPSDDNAVDYNLVRTEIRGYVDAVVGQEAYIITDDGQEIGVQLGPKSYWDEHSYYLPEGEYVTMDVWYDPYGEYTDWYFAGEIWGPGFHFALMNQYGVPYWVIVNDDYYYGLGYRASCVSYVIWFDCPPYYFVYLIMPPPPPYYYSCYYGPRWRGHYSDWHHHHYRDHGDWEGPRNPRRGRRDVERPRNEYEDQQVSRDRSSYDRWGDGDDRKMAPVPKAKPKSPITRPNPKVAPPDRVKSQPRKVMERPKREQWKPRAPKSQPRPVEQKYTPRAKPRQENQKYQGRDRSRAIERKAPPARKSPPAERRYQGRNAKPNPPEKKYQGRTEKPQVKEQKSTKRSERQVSKPPAQKQQRKSEGSRRSSGERRSDDRGRGRR